jgi:hypothetical protein
MRRPPLPAAALALALAAALGPAAAHAAGLEPTPEEAAALKPALDAEASSAAAAGLPLPAADAERAAQVQVALAPQPAPRPLPLLAVAVSGGSPEVLTASLVFRPIPWLRFFGGPAWGYVGWGMQGGVVIAPWNGGVTPTLSATFGRLLTADLSSFAGDGGTAKELRPLLARVDYQYAAADLGLEFGSPGGFALFLRLGLSFLSARANGSVTYVSDDGARVTMSDPALRVWAPSLKLGFQYWL